MPITYDIKNDYLYKEGKNEEKAETAERLLLTGKFSVKEIAEVTQLPLEKVEEINKKLKK